MLAIKLTWARCVSAIHNGTSRGIFTIPVVLPVYNLAPVWLVIVREHCVVDDCFNLSVVNELIQNYKHPVNHSEVTV